MTTTNENTALQLFTTVKKEGVLELALTQVDIPEPGPDEVLVRMEACPINPSDLGLLLAFSDASTAKVTGTNTTTVNIPADAMKAHVNRLEEPMPTGGEGAGTVVKAGTSEKAQALLGKTVSIWGGAMYAQYRTIAADECLVLPESISAAEGASCHVNPLTVIGMVSTMRMEGHKAIVHTAAASNLGQMLNKYCQAEGVELVNIVRRQEQEDLLRELGAKYVCNSSSETFLDDLIQAMAETNATLAFDAIGGGKLAGQILSCMEKAISLSGRNPGRYGSAIHKQVYIYGGLDRNPIEIKWDFGMAWGAGGWLLPYFLEKAGPEKSKELKAKVVDGLKTTFASHYTKEVPLADVLLPENIAIYSKQATGEKFLVNPSK